MPESLAIIHWRIVWVRTSGLDHILIDEAKGVEGFTFVGFIGITPAAEIGSEKFGILRNVLLGDYVFDWSRNRRGFHSIGAIPGQAKEAITGRLLELGGKGLGQFDGLVLDSQTTNGDIICANVARRSGGVAVLDLQVLPGTFSKVLDLLGSKILWLSLLED